MNNIHDETIGFRKAQFDRDEMIHGCGYWSVCDDHGCPCAVDTEFSNEVWERFENYMMQCMDDNAMMDWIDDVM